MIPVGFLLALGLYMIAVYAQLGIPTAQSQWCAEITERKLDASARIQPPKLVLLGGSASLFGIKASQMEHEIGVPTVNASTHAGMGMPYLMELGKRFLRSGDTVMLLPEYELLVCGDQNRKEWASYMYVDHIMARDPGYYRSFGVIDQIEIALLMPFDRLKKGLAGRSHPVKRVTFKDYFTYDAGLVDFHGDMTGHTAQRRPSICAARDEELCLQLVNGLPENASGFRALSGFCQWAKENKIRVLASFPNMVDRQVYHAPNAAAVETQLRDYYAKQGVPVIGRMHDAMMPSAEFFDTKYHPTEEASVKRTTRLSQLIKPWFDSGTAVAPDPPH